MNNDLISRSELKKAFEEDLKCGGVKIKEFDKGYDLGVKTAIEMLNNAPAVNPSLNLDNITEEDIEKFIVIMQRANSKGLLTINEDKPKGEWNYIQAGMCVCPFCGAYPHKDYKNFCPNCGADMRGTT